jgi:2-polyprenyl-6-methoxyphenol hydroxylase-like FAD-dependent oxidoreductase
VIIAGACPVGLFLASGLRLAKLSVRVPGKRRAWGATPGIASASARCAVTRAASRWFRPGVNEAIV